MIRAMIFDLDGTLVQTEELKALSYAKAVMELKPAAGSEADVIEAYKEVVGLSREEVAAFLTGRFGLEAAEKARLSEFGAAFLWQVLVAVRMSYYQKMISNAALIRNHRWRHNMALLREARRLSCAVGLASMSGEEEVRRILAILHLGGAFGFVAGRESVKNGKPDPEIYLLVAGKLGIPPGQCLVIEDSANGVRAALAAGMHCIAVSTPFTYRGLHEENVLDPRWIVDDPSRLSRVVKEKFAVARDRNERDRP